MAPPFEDIVIVDLDVQKTTWSRVHSAMRTLYLRLNRDPDLAWNKFFFEERNTRVEVKRHGLWIEDGYVVFDCLLIDVDSHHLPDIRQSIAYANERSRELRESQREEREQLKAKARDEAEVLKALRANIRDERSSGESAAGPTALFETESSPEPDTAASLEEAAHAQLEEATEAGPAAQAVAELPVSDYEKRLREFYEAMAPKATPLQELLPEPAEWESSEPEPAEPEPAEPEPIEVESVEPEPIAAEGATMGPGAAEATAPLTPPASAAVEPAEASELDLEHKRNDWRARFRAALQRNKN
jgi:hypothetical protein